MKGLQELTAENDALVAAAEAKRKASLRRLKQRLKTVIDPHNVQPILIEDIVAEVDAWDAAERKRGAR